jgi:hypothetical protein
VEQCRACRFWLNWDSEMTNLGECHRYPPQMARTERVEDGEMIALTLRPTDGGWPLTFPDDWCGEFQLPRERTVGTLPATPQREGDVGPAGI